MADFCFLFGHHDSPEGLEPLIQRTATMLYVTRGIDTFLVGHHGRFDAMAAAALRQFRQQYPQVRLYFLAERPDLTVPRDAGFSGILQPENAEHVPQRYALARANDKALKTCACALCYVNHDGNAQKMLEKLQKKQKPVFNLAQLAEEMPASEALR